MRCVARLALGLAVIGAAACGGGGDSETAEGPTTTVRVELTTTTPPPTTTTAAPPLSEDDQIRRTAVELFRAADALYLDPDPARVAEIYDTQCACLEAFETELADLRDRGLRATTTTVEVLGTRVDSTIEGLPVVTMVFRASEKVIVDGSGTEAERRAGTEPIGININLIRRNGRYFVSNFLMLDLVPQAMDEIMAAGVP